MLDVSGNSYNLDAVTSNWQSNQNLDISTTGLNPEPPQLATIPGLSSTPALEALEVTPLANIDGVEALDLASSMVDNLQQTQNLSSSQNTEAFQVLGTKIFDPNGQEFIAKGININGPGFGWPGTTPEYVDEITQWGFNTVRLDIGYVDPSPYLYAENGTVEQNIDAYTGEGIVVVVDPHASPGKLVQGAELDRLINWYQDLAEEYKDNPYVWFDPNGEPGGFDSPEKIQNGDWLNTYERLIKAIRSTGNDNPILVNDVYWGQGLGEWNSSDINPERSAILTQGQMLLDRLGEDGNNIVFAIHAYDQWQFGQHKFEQFFDAAKSQNLPLIVGEYGAKTDGSLETSTRDLLAVTQAREIGRIAWAWWGGDTFDLTTTGNGGGQNAEFDSSGNPTNLTWYGQQVWNDNHRPESLQQIPEFSKSSSVPRQTIRVEAEVMELTNYQVEISSIASNGQLIDLRTSGSRTGQATTVFNGVAGTYDVAVTYFDEIDGKGSLSIQVGDRPSTRIELDEWREDNWASDRARTTRTVYQAIQLQPGDAIALTGQADIEEWARVDYIELIPS